MPVALTENEADCPTQTVEACGCVVIAVAGLIVTDAEELLEQPLLFLTVALSIAALAAPAVHVRLRVPCPAVIVPPVMLHVYIAPAPASGTEAVLPVAFAHTTDGAVIVASGLGLTVIVALPDEEPLAKFASEIAVTEYVVIIVGLTVRVAGFAVTPDCVTPSDHVTFHGDAPVKVA